MPKAQLECLGYAIPLGLLLTWKLEFYPQTWYDQAWLVTEDRNVARPGTC